MKIEIEKNLRKSWFDYIGALKYWIVISLIVEIISRISETRILKLDENNVDMKILAYYMCMSIISYLLTYMFSIGYAKCAIERSRGRKLKILDLFFAFRVKPLKFLCLIITVTVLTLLWSILFIVPGIIKSISYSQAFNIMIENPEYKVNEAIKESMILMDGYKLSLGILVIILVIIVGIIMLIPIIGSIITSLILLPLSNLFFVNFYNDITLYEYE